MYYYNLDHKRRHKHQTKKKINFSLQYPFVKFLKSIAASILRFVKKNSKTKIFLDNNLLVQIQRKYLGIGHCILKNAIP